MSEKDLIFCEAFEAKLRQFDLLRILKNELTPTGQCIYDKITEWLLARQDRYFEIMEKNEKSKG